MEKMTKSHIYLILQKAIKDEENLVATYVEKKTGKIINVNIEIHEGETFTDEKGQKWRRIIE